MGSRASAAARSPRRSRASDLAVDETVILLHPPLPLAGVSIVMERGCQQNDSLVRGYFRPRLVRAEYGPSSRLRPALRAAAAVPPPPLPAGSLSVMRSGSRTIAAPAVTLQLLSVGDSLPLRRSTTRYLRTTVRTTVLPCVLNLPYLAWVSIWE